MRAAVRALVFSVLLASLAAPHAAAQGWENDVRIRYGLWTPSDLPTDPGPVLGFEIRNLLWERDGLIYGVHLYDEQKEETEPFGTGTVDLMADIRLTPFLFGWFHVVPQEHVNFMFGAGIGLYVSDAFSGGVTSTSQVSDVGDYRFLEDDVYFGTHVFFGADFFPKSRWGLGAEARLHIVENDFSATELGAGGIFRF